MTEQQGVHGLLVTYRRPDILRDHLRRLAEQTAPLDTLLVVDNAADPLIEALTSASLGAATGSVDYLPLTDNPGPAGAIAAGIEVITSRVDGNDWLVLLDDDDPPPNPDTLEAIQKAMLAARVSDADCVGVGLWGASLRRHGRLRVAQADAAASVDYLPGGACPHYLVSALRSVDAPDRDLFFGFDDLDLGLALRGAGGNLYSSGLARGHGLAHMVEARRTRASVGDPSWRRYYSLRNLIVILRRNRRLGGALWMTATAGFVKPILNLVIRPRRALANLRLNVRATTDGWRGRLGKPIDPSTGPPA